MEFSKFDMFRQSNVGQVFGTATTSAMVLHPVLFWSAFAAVGAGAVAGLNRAIAERSDSACARAQSMSAINDFATSASGIAGNTAAIGWP